nr:transposase [Spirosoma foliorum]
MSRKYKVRDQSKVYFITCTVVQWIDVFTRRHYKDIVLDSIRYCIAEKGLELYAYCLMTNHLHMIVGDQQKSNRIHYAGYEAAYVYSAISYH